MIKDTRIIVGPQRCMAAGCILACLELHIFILCVVASHSYICKVMTLLNSSANSNMSYSASGQLSGLLILSLFLSGMPLVFSNMNVYTTVVYK